MKKYLLLLTVFVAGILINIQNSYSQVDRLHWCATDDMYQKAIKENPDYAKSQALLEQYTQEFIRNHQLNIGANQKTQGTVYVIPIVFHVIHQWGSENISDAQIFDQVNILNRDFRKLNADTTAIIPSFQTIAADCEIEFRLAQIDPNGNCTNGIDRIVSSKTNAADDGSKLNDWPRNEYLNVWTVKTIGMSGVAGYAYFPSVTLNPAIDGVIILSDYIGSIGTSSPYNSRSLTHEIGHFLNLQHPWGNTNSNNVTCGDDQVFDTPVTKGSATGVCNLNLSVCNPPIIENVQNYMDYSYCTKMFTAGQKLRMDATLNSTVCSRNNLWTFANLLATGTDGTVYTCIPTANFNPALRFVCAGSTLTFSDNSLNLNGPPLSRQWTFPGGTPPTDTSANPVVQYNFPGVYDVILTVSSSAGSNTDSIPGLVTVTPLTGTNAIPYSEDFENLSTPFPGTNPEWAVQNDAGNAWELSPAAAHSGAQALRLYNYTGNGNGTQDIFITPTYDLTNVTSANLYFWLAYAIRSNSSTDNLTVYVSKDCGSTWNIRYNKTGTTLSTAGLISSNFVPTSSQWRLETVNISSSSYNNQPNIRFKFQYTQNSGNNMYIDDLNLNGVVGIEEQAALNMNLSLFPNPAENVTTMGINLKEQQHVKIRLYDVLGQEVSLIADKNFAAGEHRIEISARQSGLYTLRIETDDAAISRKVIFQNGN